MADPLDNTKINDFVSRARQIAPQVIEILGDLDGFSVEWFSNGWNEGGVDAINQDNLLGENAGLTVQDLRDLIFTYETLRAAMDGGHRGNLQIARP